MRRLMNEGSLDPVITVTPIDTINQEDCGTWTQIGAHSATVSMARLLVPGKARGVYLKACGELKKKKLDDAQRDAQHAVDAYHEYPAAWVLLGQAYYDGNQLEQAHEACLQASRVDPGYVASYLCLAAVADRQKAWDEAQTQSNNALKLSPLKNAYACYYKAEAAYHEGSFVDAEKSGLDAAAADSGHQMPEIELLLARVYSAMKNTDAAAVRVRDYLRFAHQPADPAAVSAQLAQITASDDVKPGDTAAH
jgi:tetratricopeptide (TPR) repeat protein